MISLAWTPMAGNSENKGKAELVTKTETYEKAL